MASLCTVTLIGRLTADAKSSTVGQKATPLAKFCVAYDTGFGQYARSNFLQCELWGKQATNLQEYLTKGKQVGVSGTLENKKWTGQDGVEHDSWTINVSSIMLMASPKQDSEPSPAAFEMATDVVF